MTIQNLTLLTGFEELQITGTASDYQQNKYKGVIQINLIENVNIVTAF